MKPIIERLEKENKLIRKEVKEILNMFLQYEEMTDNIILKLDKEIEELKKVNLTNKLKH